MEYPKTVCPRKTWKSERAHIQTLLYKCVVVPNIDDLREEDFTFNSLSSGGKVIEITIRRKVQEDLY